MQVHIDFPTSASQDLPILRTLENIVNQTKPSRLLARTPPMYCGAHQPDAGQAGTVHQPDNAGPVQAGQSDRSDRAAQRPDRLATWPPGGQ